MFCAHPSTCKHICNSINKIIFKESLKGSSYISTSPVSRSSWLSLDFPSCKTLGKWRIICVTTSGDFCQRKDWNTNSSLAVLYKQPQIFVTMSFDIGRASSWKTLWMRKTHFFFQQFDLQVFPLQVTIAPELSLWFAHLHLLKISTPHTFLLLSSFLHLFFFSFF